MSWRSELHPIIEEAVSKAGSVSALARETGIARQTISKWIAKTAGPTAGNLAKIMAYMGVQPVQVGQEKVETVSLTASAFEGGEVPSEYAAVPLLKDPDAIIGDDLFVPEANIASYALPMADSKTVRNRPHVVAINVTDNAMSPLLDPGDLVYIDRADVAVHGHGEIFLVRDAKTGAAVIRRVCEYEEDGELYLLYSADNPKVPPRHYSVRKHFAGNRRQAILGRAVTARVDLLNL